MNKYKIIEKHIYYLSFLIRRHRLLGTGSYNDLASKIKVLKILFGGFEFILYVIDAEAFFMNNAPKSMLV